MSTRAVPSRAETAGALERIARGVAENAKPFKLRWLFSRAEQGLADRGMEEGVQLVRRVHVRLLVPGTEHAATSSRGSMYSYVERVVQELGHTAPGADLDALCLLAAQIRDGTEPRA